MLLPLILIADLSEKKLSQGAHLEVCTDNELSSRHGVNVGSDGVKRKINSSLG